MSEELASLSSRQYVWILLPPNFTLERHLQLSESLFYQVKVCSESVD